MASSVALCLLLCAVTLLLHSSPAEAQADLALDCCLSVSHRAIPKQILHSYRKQVKGQGCPIDAVIFITRRGRHLCAPGVKEEHWVEEHVKILDARYKKCKENKFQTRYCQTLKSL